MQIFGKNFNLFNSDLKKEVISLRNEVYSNRPSLDYLQARGEDIKIQVTPVPLRVIYEMADFSDIIRTILNALKGETFRNGYEWKPVFVSKCAQCKEEYQHNPDACENCGNNVFIKPDTDQYREVDKTFKNKVNLNNQSFLDVCEFVENDLNAVDFGILLMLKDYFFRFDGTLAGAKVREIIRGDPVFISLVMNNQGIPGMDNQGRFVLTCVNHRDKIQSNETEDKKCGNCGSQMFKTVAVATNMVGYGKRIHYIEGEVIWRSKYKPTIVYGFPPILTVWKKVMTLFNMDSYMQDYYGKMRQPKGILAVPTRSVEMLQKFWDQLLHNAVKQPNTIQPFGYAPEKGVRAKIEFIDFMNKLNEMEYTETREEMRRTIGAAWSVLPIFVGDTSTSGGLNNEGLQITVTNRAIQKAQKLWNEEIFPLIVEQFGITDWKLMLKASEEKDEMAEIQRDIARAQHARMMVDLGFNIKASKENDKEFEFEEPPEGIQARQNTFNTENLPGLNSGIEIAPQPSFGGAPSKPAKEIKKKLKL